MPSGKHGRLVVIAAPSGAGKTTLVHEIIRRHPEIRFSISYTTRPPRQSEKNGRDYFFVDENKFQAMLLSDAFLESARVFGHWYGTSWEYVNGFLKQGNTVLLEIDWQGANQVRLRMPEAIGIFILPPNRQELERRLRGRGTDSDGAIKRRLRDALTDMLHWKEFDYVLVSDSVEKCADAFEDILDGQGELNRANSLSTQERVVQILDSDT